jgi:hypothetical protein
MSDQPPPPGPRPRLNIVAAILMLLVGLILLLPVLWSSVDGFAFLSDLWSGLTMGQKFFAGSLFLLVWIGTLIMGAAGIVLIRIAVRR